MAVADAPGVGVDNKNRQFESIEENAVGGFGANAIDLQQRVPQDSKWGMAGVLRIVFLPPATEMPETAGLETVKAGRGQQGGQSFVRQGRQRRLFQASGVFEVGDGSRGIVPVGVLGQHGADCHFPGSFGRPPVLRAVGGTEYGIDVGQRAGEPIQGRRVFLDNHLQESLCCL